MTKQELKARTRRFAVDLLKFAVALPPGPATAVIGRQLIKSGTAVGANYRSSCRAKSDADFIAKMTIVEEEADETQYWLEVLVEAGLARKAAIERLYDECEQLLKITVASINTTRGGPRSQ